MNEIKSQYQQLKDERDQLLLKVAELERRLAPMIVYEIRTECGHVVGLRHTDSDKAFAAYDAELKKKLLPTNLTLMAVRHEEWPVQWTDDQGAKSKGEKV